MNILNEYTYKVTANYNTILEEHIKIVLNDKPKYMPTFLWHKLIKIIIRTEVHK